MQHKLAGTRLSTGKDGKSRFDPLEISLHDNAGADQLSRLIRGEGVILSYTAPGFEWLNVNAPRRQFVFTISGAIEIEVPSGERRVFAPGSLLFAEDLDGPGHHTRVVSAEPWVCAYVPVTSDESGAA